MAVPNLDAITHSELMNFWAKYHRPKRAEAAELLGHTQKGYVGTVETLAAYACAKACAMRLRLEGKITQALSYEQDCDIYYKQLPKGDRW